MSFSRNQFLAAATLLCAAGAIRSQRTASLNLVVAAPATANHAGSESPQAMVPPLSVISIKEFGRGVIRDKSRRILPIRVGLTADGVSGTDVTAEMLLMRAYNVDRFHIVHEPGWAKSYHFNIDARVAAPDAAAASKLTYTQKTEFYQQVLRDRFGLVMHPGRHNLPEYALTVAPGGTKLMQGSGTMDISSLLRRLSQATGRTVVDKTGLTGKYDLSLSWSQTTQLSDPFLSGGALADNPPLPSDSAGPDVFTALQLQLGLKLMAIHGPAAVMVIDQIHKPKGN
jgi:hypothetical protein